MANSLALPSGRADTDVSLHYGSDVLNKAHEVRAVHRRVGEAGAWAIAVGIKAAAADLMDAAGLALSRQRSPAKLPRNHPRQQEGVVQSIGCDVQPSLWRTMICRLEYVNLLD